MSLHDGPSDPHAACALGPVRRHSSLVPNDSRARLSFFSLRGTFVDHSTRLSLMTWKCGQWYFFARPAGRSLAPGFQPGIKQMLTGARPNPGVYILGRNEKLLPLALTSLHLPRLLPLPTASLCPPPRPPWQLSVPLERRSETLGHHHCQLPPCPKWSSQAPHPKTHPHHRPRCCHTSFTYLTPFHKS